MHVGPRGLKRGYVASDMTLDLACREEAVMQQGRVVRALHLQEMAACCDAEAATWRLLWHLYGTDSRAYPGSLGGPKLPGCTRALTVAQQIAAMLEQDAELNRCGELSWPECVLSRLIGPSIVVPCKTPDMMG